jgi:hypothetical protein
LNKQQAVDLIDLLISLEQHEKPNYEQAKDIWTNWIKVDRHKITGNPSDHPLYPYRHKDLIYYEQLGESIERVVRHIKFDMLLGNNTDEQEHD